MSTKWLNFFFKLSAVDFKLKERMISAKGWYKAAFYALVIFLFEIILLLVTLPLYFMVSPGQVQERGVFFPAKEREPVHIHAFIVRRKISLVTILSASGLFVIKAAFVAIVSFYLLGAQTLLAATQNWTFDVSTDYTYNSAAIEVVSGVARLKDTGSTTTGSTTNSGFDSGSTGWTYADWLNGGNVVGAYKSSGGNPGGYIDIAFNPKNGKTTAGLWRQAFTTTVSSPDTATVNLDWSSIVYSVPASFTTYKIYVFVDTSSANPTLGTEVWSSGEITSTTSWASIPAIDITSKIATAGTYYLKVAAYNITPATAGTYTATLGFDNVIVNWSKTTHVYASNSPSINPNTSLSMTKTVSWDGFTETATKNGGEIYYQLSSDDGSTWQYWAGSAWAAAGAGNFNIATDINTHIGTFSTSSNKIMWKAFLSGNGSQQVILDNVAITYTENTPPNVINLAPAQNTNYGYVNVAYNLQDANSDPSSLVTYEYSLTGAFTGEQVTMTASSTDPAHSGVTGLTTSPTGVAHTFVWDAKSQLGAVYNTGVYVRMRGNDGIQNGPYTTSTAFTVDYVDPVVSNVSAVETLGSTNVAISYDLADNTTDNLTVELQISGDGGATWTVPATSVTGTVGTGITAGTSKTITWAAGTDYTGQQKSNMQVRIRAKDKWQNQGSYTASSNFSLDTLNPATNVTADLQSQPVAGASTVLIGGSFTEVNPNLNNFYVAINGGDYGSPTAGDSNTASPTNQATATSSTLTGHDYVSKVKIIHIDDYGNSGTNENLSPSSTYKYVKPYTPSAPTLSNPVTNRLDLQINEAVGEASDLEYAVQETTTGNYLQSDGTLGATITWQILGTSAGQWGNGLSVRGKVRVTGLSSPVSQYIFKVKSRNPSDTAHAASSESNFSSTAQIPNTAPSITLNSNTQTTDGTQYVPINYTGTDGQGDISSLSLYEYSQDNSTWHTMTEKTGVGSNGVSNLVFLPTGSNYVFAWNSGTDLPNVEDSTVYVRLRPNDSLVNGSTATSAALAIDNKSPVTDTVSASQNAGARTVAISYNLTDANNSTVELDISSDGGSTWNVATSSASGAVGVGITPGSGKTITWNAGADFNNQYNTNMKVRVRARDTFGNQGTFAESNIFTVDTHAPSVTNVNASQDAGADTFTFTYDVSEDAGNVTVGLEISSDNGSTWTVPVTSAAGAIGTVVPGTGKTITWNGTTDYNNQEKTAMQIRLTATDSYSNAGVTSSSAFSLDTKAPRVTNVTASETLGTTNVVINYDLADQNNSLVEIDISSDGGSTWTVTDTSVTGDIGSGISAGTNKSITWAAGTDFDEHQISNMQVRVRAKDTYNNQSANVNSSNFSLDTLNPVVNVTADLKTQPNAGDTTALIGGSFTEVNPNTNVFYVAIDGGDYGASATGTANTASPADLATNVGATLDGNDYVSKVKIVHTDDYGQTVNNENTSPNTGYKYVKPYTPAAPTVDNPSVGGVDVTINKNAAETDGLEYAIYESSQNKYVQADGTLGASPVWQTLGTGVGQWGSTSGISGKINVNGLTTYSYLYQFQVESRNTSDASHAASSESALSAGASSANQSPVINLVSVAQTTDGSQYVTINYNGYDLEADTVSLVNYQYSRDNSTWVSMTEKTGVGSDGTTGLAFGNSGAGNPHDFMWDVGTDLPNTEDNTVYIRLRANDGTSNGNYSASSAFTVDTKNPVISSVTASQTVGSGNVSVGYTLTDLSSSNVEFGISDDAGSTWNVTTSTKSGDVGANVTPGSGKNIVWGAGTDFPNQEQNDLRARAKAIDAFGNIGSFASSANFSLDTKAPTVASVSAVQNLGANTVAVTYTLSDANTSDVAIDISEDGGSTWGVTDTSVTGDIGPGITPGNKSFTWNAAVDFPNRDQGNMMIRVRATDTYNNASGNVDSPTFNVDTKAPVVTNVSAAQLAGSRYVSINYDLSDSSLVTIQMDISNDGGATWTVTDTSVSGDVGSGITQGNNKVIVWNAGVDFNNQDQNNMRVRVRGLDPYNNSSGNIESANFSVDTKAPVVLTSADLTAQPHAGDTTASILAAFTETNPNTNDFLIAIDGGTYSATTTGDGNTATPSAQATAVGATLNGSDYISKVKVVETDDYNQSTTSENTSPNVSYKFVKPYTPPAPTVDNPQNTSVDVAVNTFTGEASNLQYAIYEVSSNKYVQADGTLGASAVWQTLGTAAGEWGNTTGISGKVTVQGLTSPVANYSFETKSRNPSDTAHAVSSESAFSLAAGIANTAPSVSINSASQQAGTNYVLISYTGTDAQNDTNNLAAYEYSTDNSTWASMTEKSGVGSSGTSGLIFASTGTAYTFAWDVATDLPNTADPTVYVRLKSTDTLVESNLAVSSAFAIDTLGPVISNISTSQNPGTNLLTFNYDLADNSGGGVLIQLLISDDNGSTYTVATTTLSGDVGSGISVGTGRTVTWNAGVDFANQEQSSMKLKIRGRDSFGNWGNFVESNTFSADAKAPVVSAVSASEIAGSNNVSINYTLSDLSTSGNVVEFNISDDGGATWNVATTTVSGEIGSGQTTGSKTFTWNAGTDLSGVYQTDIRARVKATDYFGNQGNFSNSSNFTLDTKSPVISNITAAQTLATENFVFTYDLTENSGNSTIEMEVSPDGGITWNVATTTLSGAIGGGVAAGNSKTITWNAGTDYNGQEKNSMRIRLKATDGFANQSAYLSSADFSLDTGAPIGLASLTKFSSTTSTVTLTWASGVTDANFNHYELWYGSNENDVINATGTALKWSVADDPNLSSILTNSTVITGLNVTDNFYVKIFAVDNYNNISTTADINIFSAAPAPTPTAAPAAGTIGGVLVTPAPIVPIKPILTPLDTPTNNTSVIIRGIAAPRVRIDLYDNGIFVGRLSSLSGDDGTFRQTFTFSPGSHSFSVVAVDLNNNASDPSDPVNLVITTVAPAAPLIFSPKNNDTISGNEIVVVGGGVPLGVVQASVEGTSYTAPINADGAWQIVVPNVNQLSDGLHTLNFKVTDAAGNNSPSTLLTLNKVTAVIPAVTPPSVVGPITAPAAGPTAAPVAAPGLLTGISALQPTALPQLPIPPVRLIEETAGAVELPALPVPIISNVQVATAAAQPNLIAFTGTALPNQEVLVYIHSDQALIYRTRANNAGVWNFTHDQNITELNPGEHSIYAVAVDTDAKVKSRPSALAFFTVKKNFWVTLFNLLNLPTTIVAVIILSGTIFWLYRLKRKETLVT